METWEYLDVTFSFESNNQWSARWSDATAARLEQGTMNGILNAIGNLGWELVSFGTPGATYAAIFKRRKP